jgi:hypothetical protein
MSGDNFIGAPARRADTSNEPEPGSVTRTGRTSDDAMMKPQRRLSVS